MPLNKVAIFKLTVSIIVCILFSTKIFATSPTLSASATQPCYPGTTISYLPIVAGSGKTSYISAAWNDPVDPAKKCGIYFTITGTFTSITATSSDTTIVTNSNLIIIDSGDFKILKINPNGLIGYSTISVIASNAGQNSSTYKIKYAVSAGSSRLDNTVWPTNMADASGISAVDENFLFACDDETNIIRLYHRKLSGKDLYNVDITNAVGASAECDLEGSTTSQRFNIGKRIYWIGSLGNSKSGNLKPDRNRVFTTDVIGAGSGSTLTVRSYSTAFRPALINWGNAMSWNFTASAADGVPPKQLDGFNVEGLSVTHGGDTAFIGFRAPCVPLKNTIPTATNRRYAIIAPVNNFETMMNGNGLITTAPQIGEPILFDLEGLGIRSIERVGTRLYLIVAGLYTGGGMPVIYLWDGRIPDNSGMNPINTQSTHASLIKLNLPEITELVQVSTDGSAEGHPEAIIAEQDGEFLDIDVVCDNGTIDYYGDGTEAKSLSNLPHRKFRIDHFVYDLTPYHDYCSNDTIHFYSGISASAGTSYQWQMDNGNGFINLLDNDIYHGVHDDTLKIIQAPTNLTGALYRCYITDGLNSSYSNIDTLRFKSYWIGGNDTNWEVPGNWSCGLIPDEFTDVYIHQGAPILNTDFSIRRMQSKHGSRLIVKPNVTLRIKGF